MARDNMVGIEYGRGVGAGGQKRATGENSETVMEQKLKNKSFTFSKEGKNKFYLKKDKIDFCNCSISTNDMCRMPWQNPCHYSTEKLVE